MYLNIFAGSVDRLLGEQLVKLWWLCNFFKQCHCYLDDVAGGSARVVVFNATVGEENLDGWITYNFIMILAFPKKRIILYVIQYKL